MNESFPEGSAAPVNLPYSKEAEEAVIGAILINPEVYFDVAQFLQADDFYIHRLRWIWEAYVHLQETKTPIDPLTVVEELREQGHLEEVGGAAYLTALASQVPISFHAEAYGRVVEAHSVRRKLLTAANRIATMAYDEGEEITTVLDEAEKAVFTVSERRMRNDVAPLKEVMGEVYKEIIDLSERDEEIVGVPTGFRDLDKLLGGLQKSDFLIIAGRPGQGKSGFLLSVARNAAVKEKKHVALFSLEMSNEQVVQRLLSQETGIDSQRLRMGKLYENDRDLLNDALVLFDNTVIFLDDTPAITPMQLRTKCRRLDLEHGLDLILVDYLQLMSGGRRIDNRVQEVSHISRSLKVLARELNVPVLAAAQLSRAVEQRADKRPMLSDLRESGSLEQDADIVMFIYRPDDKLEGVKSNVTKIIVAKHRNGPVGEIELIFRPSITKFEDAATKRFAPNED